jgi:hypothetical protein
MRPTFADVPWITSANKRVILSDTSSWVPTFADVFLIPRTESCTNGISLQSRDHVRTLPDGPQTSATSAGEPKCTGIRRDSTPTSVPTFGRRCRHLQFRFVDRESCNGKR